jgi:hypothetical protein
VALKNKYLKYSLKGLVVLLSLFVVLYIIVFTYVSVNKRKIIKDVTDEIGKKLIGNVTIGDVELSFLSHFPSVSVELHNVQVTDTMFALHHHVFFNGEKVYVNLGIFNMIRKKSFINGFRIDNGSFYVYTDTSGYTNKYLFNPKRDTAKGKNSQDKGNVLKKIVLNNVEIIEDDRQRNKLHDIVVNELKLRMEDKDSTSFLFSAEANMKVKSLAFNLEKGSFLKNKVFRGDFKVQYNKLVKQIQLDSINIKLDGQPFNVTARFDMAGQNRQFSLRVHTNNVLYADAKSLLPEKVSAALAVVDADKPIDISADLIGPLKGGDPLIAVNFATKKTHLKTQFLDFDDASFKGFYTNEIVPGLPRKDPNSKIVITDFSAAWNGLPVTSDSIQIINLFEPTLICDLQSSFSLTTFNDIIASNTIQLTSGEGKANISYKGPLLQLNNITSFLNGYISFKNGTVLYKPRDVELKNVNGKIAFRNSDVFVENLQCNVLNNKIFMEGTGLNLLTLVDAEPDKANIDWKIYSPSLNLNSFIFLLHSRKKVSVQHSGKHGIGNLAGKIDKVIEEGSWAINLKADKLIYKKFEASNTLANVSLVQDSYIINNVSMEHAGGRMDMKGSLVTQSNNTHHAKINVSLDNIDVSKTFAAFNNFGQDGITSESISGKLTAKVDASMDINDEGQATPASLESIVDFSLKDGTLNNYEPIKKLKNFLFKNRDFDNIRFAELKDRFEIKNQEVKINRMEIQSSVMTMFVEGVYSKKGNTDISIQVPLSNIHKRGADFNPENIGTDVKAGSSIYLRGRPGDDGKIKFKLDLFKKYKKDKKKAN